MEAHGGETLDLLDRSLAVLLTWHGGLEVDPELQEGPLADSRRWLLDGVRRALAPTPQQRLLASSIAVRGSEVLAALAVRHLAHHARLLACAGATAGRCGYRPRAERDELTRSLDRFLSAAFSVANGIGRFLTDAQQRRIERLAADELSPGGPGRWLVELATITHRDRATVFRTLEEMAVPPEVVEAAATQAALGRSPRPVKAGAPDRILMWMTSDSLAAALRSPVCLTTTLLTLLVLTPGFLGTPVSTAAGTAVSIRREPSIGEVTRKETVK